jgi:ubiquitin C-terminal hydrolase
MVTYPVEAMDITEWIEEPNLAVHKYDLYAVCLHQGTAEFGHYRAYCKHFVSG